MLPPSQTCRKARDRHMKTEPQRPGSVPVSKEVEEIVRQRLAEPGDEKGKPWSEVKYVFVRIKASTCTRPTVPRVLQIMMLSTNRATASHAPLWASASTTGSITFL